MTTYLWGAVLARGETLFGEAPGPDLEQRVLHHFETNPNRLVTLIESIGKRVAAGTVKSGWAILDRELARQHPDVKVDDKSERTKQILLTEQWIRTTGGNLDCEAELIDAVFGPYGRLYLWDQDQPLINRIVKLWEAERPRFQASEAEAETRMARNAIVFKRLRKASKGAPSSESADEHAMRVHAEVERARLAYLESLAPDEDEDLDRPAGPPDPEGDQ